MEWGLVDQGPLAAPDDPRQRFSMPQTMTPPTLAADLLHRMDAYWRAADYLSVGRIYLYDHPLLTRPLTLADVKPSSRPAS